MLLFIQQLMVQIPSERVALHYNFDTIAIVLPMSRTIEFCTVENSGRR